MPIINSGQASRRVSPNIIAEQVGRPSKKMRRPQHPYSVMVRPFAITPFLIAPVLPGESLQNLFIQARAVSDPLADKLGGWWFENYIFYVKHRDLTNRADLVDMHLQLNKDMSAYNPAARLEYYETASGGIAWVEQCLRRVVEEYFRDQDEAWNNVTIASGLMTTGLPAARIAQESWMQSLYDETAISEGGTLPDEDAGATFEDFDRAERQYHFLLQEGMVDMSFEDYLETFGVKKRREELHKPELLRMWREWSYPTNTVDPATGVPTTAMSWTIRGRADKKRYFREPGFVFGVTVCRPKVFLSKQKCHASSMLDGALAWLPAILNDDPRSSLMEFTNATGPLHGNITNGYILDAKDLFLYGDQFINHALTRTDVNFVPLPTTAVQHKYPASADIDALFVAADPDQHIRVNGLVSLHIMSHVSDTTPVGAGGIWR